MQVIQRGRLVACMLEHIEEEYVGRVRVRHNIQVQQLDVQPGGTVSLKWARAPLSHGDADFAISESSAQGSTDVDFLVRLHRIQAGLRVHASRSLVFRILLVLPSHRSCAPDVRCTNALWHQCTQTCMAVAKSLPRPAVLQVGADGARSTVRTLLEEQGLGNVQTVDLEERQKNTRLLKTIVIPIQGTEYSAPDGGGICRIAERSPRGRVFESQPTREGALSWNATMARPSVSWPMLLMSPRQPLMRLFYNSAM